MTPVEILHKIVDADINARSVADGTQELCDGFDDYIKTHIDSLHDEIFASADAETARYEKTAVADTEKELARLDEKYGAELDAVKRRYESQRDSIVDRIFKMAVDVDA